MPTSSEETAGWDDDLWHTIEHVSDSVCWLRRDACARYHAFYRRQHLIAER